MQFLKKKFPYSYWYTRIYTPPGITVSNDRCVLTCANLRLVGHALTASIHGNHHDQWIRSVALSINRRIACDYYALARDSKVRGAIRSDPNRSWEDHQPLRFTASHLLLRGTSTYWLTVGLREEGLLFLFLAPSLFLSRGFHHKAELEFPFPRASARDNSVEESRLRLTLLIPWIDFTITRYEKKDLADRADVLSTSWKVTRDAKPRAAGNAISRPRVRYAEPSKFKRPREDRRSGRSPTPDSRILPDNSERLSQPR